MTEQLWKNKAEILEQRVNFLHCIGAIDGKNIKIVKPTETGSQHFNYKHYFSIVLLAVVDTNYKFLYIDFGFYRKDFNSTIFKNSTCMESINKE